MSKPTKPTMHYMVEYGPDGYPAQLRWNSEIQKSGEAAVARLHAERAREEAIHNRPAPWIEEWLVKRTKT